MQVLLVCLSLCLGVHLTVANLFDKVAAAEAYEAVRSDDTTWRWAAMRYDGRKLEDPILGKDYSDFLALCTDNDRLYGYVRFETGDEMNRRAMFAFITWIGPRVGALKKAKVSSDKAFVKKVWSEFGKEVLEDDKSELAEAKILKILETALAAGYGTGK